MKNRNMKRKKVKGKKKMKEIEKKKNMTSITIIKGIIKSYNWRIKLRSPLYQSLVSGYESLLLV